MAEKLRINDIRTDGGTQSRAGLSRSYVEDYALLLQEAQEAGLENGEVVWPFRDPVEVYHDGEAYWLVDGFHRVEACKQVGRYVVQANVHQGTLRDAILASFAANAEHGLPRGHEDKKRAVRRMLADDEWCKRSSREIARCCKVSHTMVNKIRDEMQQSDTGNNSSMERTYIHPKSGRETVMNTANIAESNQRRVETAVPTPEQIQGLVTRAANDVIFDGSSVEDYAALFRRWLDDGPDDPDWHHLERRTEGIPQGLIGDALHSCYRRVAVDETAVSDDFTDEPPPRLAVWALERHVSAWLHSDIPARAGFIHDALDALQAIKSKQVGWRVPFDSIKSEIGLANYTDGDLRQAINNVINQAGIERRDARDQEQMAGLPALPTRCPECGDDLIIDTMPAPNDSGRATLDGQCVGCARQLFWVAWVGESEWTWEGTFRSGVRNSGVRNGEQTVGGASPAETATYWLKNYVDPVHNRIWADLEDNQVHHANSPCAQAFRKQYPDFKDHKALLKTALANLKREKAAGIAESVKGLRVAVLQLMAQTSYQELSYKLNMVAEDLEMAYKIAQAAETAVSEEA